MNTSHQVTRFVDTFLADGSVERRYDQGVVERRTVRAPGRIAWSDDHGRSGVDVDLGEGVVERQREGGAASVGTHLGNGITSWDGGAFITVNETPFPDVPHLAPPRPRGLAGIFVALGLGGLFGFGARWEGVYGVEPDSPAYWLYAELAQARLAQQVPVGRAFALDPRAPDPRRHDYPLESFG